MGGRDRGVEEDGRGGEEGGDRGEGEGEGGTGRVKLMLPWESRSRSGGGWEEEEKHRLLSLCTARYLTPFIFASSAAAAVIQF